MQTRENLSELAADADENLHEEPLVETPKRRATPEEIDDERRGPAPVGILRKGYTIAMGDRVLFGRRKIPLTAEVARLHLHKFENTREIKLWLGIPVQEDRPDAISDSTRRGREAIDARRRGREPGAPLTGPSEARVRAIVADAVTELGKSLSDSMAMQISEGLARIEKAAAAKRK